MGRPKNGVTFWDRVFSQAEKAGECLLFSGHKTKDGYGRINKDGTLVLVHRAVWERENGPIPTGLVVMHACDTPACIEKSHLQIGTRTENNADRDRKGRQRPSNGSNNGLAKLCESDIPVIRNLIKDGCEVREIAKRFLVSRYTIYGIKNARIWQHVGQA